MAMKGAVEVNTEQCKGCGVCVVNCPAETLALSKDVNGKGYNYSFPANPDECTGCANCALVCPDTVITVYRIKI